MAKNMWNPGGVIGDVALGLAAAGTAQGTATTQTADHVTVTTSTSSANGVLMKTLNAGELTSLMVDNACAYGVNWYPPSGMKLNGNTANLAVYIPPGRVAWALFLNATHISVNVGA